MGSDMLILRVFPRRTSYTPTDELTFVGDPQLWQPKADEVHVSCTFTWDIVEAKRLQLAWSRYYPMVHLGGPAFGDVTTQFIPGRYIKPGVTFTTRGCDNHCPWCLVPDREGKLVEVEDFAPGWIIQDNNLLQASHDHILRVFEMLKNQKKSITFAGGLQASLIDDWFLHQLRGIRIDSLFLAADTPGSLKTLAKTLQKLSWLKRRQLQVYCMIGLDQTLQEAENHLRTIWWLGGMPFAQLYQPPDHFIQYSLEWKALARTWSRPAAMFSQMDSD